LVFNNHMNRSVYFFTAFWHFLTGVWLLMYPALFLF